MNIPGRWANGYLGDVLNRSRPAVAPFGVPGSELAAVEIHLVDPAVPTLIAFGGMAHQLMMPASAFMSSLATSRVNVLFVKDLRQCWYQRGLRGLGTDPRAAADALRPLVPEGSPLIGTVGTSAGGTGAILLGSLLRVPRIVAFSPRTLVDRAAVSANRAAGTPVGNFRIRLPYCDMAVMLKQFPVPQVDIHVGALNDQDRVAAGRVAPIPGVRVHLHDTSEHTVARYLRHRDELGPVLRAAFGLQAD